MRVNHGRYTRICGNGINRCTRTSVQLLRKCCAEILQPVWVNPNRCDITLQTFGRGDSVRKIDLFIDLTILISISLPLAATTTPLNLNVKAHCQARHKSCNAGCLAFGANRCGTRLTTIRPDICSLSLRTLQIALMLLPYRAASARPLFLTSSTIGPFFIDQAPA